MRIIRFPDDNDFRPDLPIQLELGDHARQHEDRVPSGGKESTGSPSVPVADVAERWLTTWNASQIFEITRDRQKQEIDTAVEHPLLDRRSPAGVIKHRLILPGDSGVHPWLV